MAVNLEVSKEKLLKDMKRTKGVRFNASRRLARQEKLVTNNTAYASVAVIIVTLMPVFFSLPTSLVSVIALATVGLSIFILVTTLLHSAQNIALKADQFHRCALEVNALRRELLASDTSGGVISEMASRYDQILGRYNINHEDVDYDRYRLEHPSEFEDVAVEDVSSARKNVTSKSRAAERPSVVIVIVTIGLTFSVILLEFFPQMGVLLDWFISLF